jgi:hypothetical protein
MQTHSASKNIGVPASIAREMADAITLGKKSSKAYPLLYNIYIKHELEKEYKNVRRWGR